MGWIVLAHDVTARSAVSEIRYAVGIYNNIYISLEI